MHKHFIIRFEHCLIMNGLCASLNKQLFSATNKILGFSPTCMLLRKCFWEDVVNIFGYGYRHKVREKQEAAFCLFLVLAV